MRVWRSSRWDAVLLVISLAQFSALFWSALVWGHSGPAVRSLILVVTTAVITYGIVVISHLFTHKPWFVSARLNAAASVLNSVVIGQSVQAYQFTHVRNHHRFNNDPRGADGTTRDLSSTYRGGTDAEHAPVVRYVVLGALRSLTERGAEVLAVARGWRVGPGETTLLSLATRHPGRRRRELRLIQADRAAHVLSLAVFALISWQWLLACYLPAFALALMLVNVQNYYRHYGADPAERSADSVSHYGRLYNLLTFNDGFHQEHHLNPTTHWSQMREVFERNRDEWQDRRRIVSPVPAMLGFLHRDRPLLHRGQASGGVTMRGAS